MSAPHPSTPAPSDRQPTAQSTAQSTAQPTAQPTSRPPEPIRVVAVFIRDLAGRVLTVRKRGTDSFMQPGGKPEPGESPEQTAVRELAEELGAQLADLHLIGTRTAAAANEPGRLVEAVVFTARLVSMAGPQAEIEELLWYDPVAPQIPDAQVAPLLRDVVLPTIPVLPPVTVVGIGADGHLHPAAVEAVAAADLVVGGARQLALVPAAAGQEQRALPQPLRPGLEDLLTELAERDVVVLASGDPMLSGIGTTLRTLVGARLRVLPAVSSVALARAAMGWSAEETEVVSLVARDVDLIRRPLTNGRRIVVLSADESTPAAVAALLVEEGWGASRMSVLGDLGAEQESRLDTTADDEAWASRSCPRLNVIAIQVAPGAVPSEGLVTRDANSWAPGLADETYAHDGQLTKRDIRASALARLAPRPGELLWDIGAGAGSIGIEWMRAHPTCGAIAIEADPARLGRIGDNAHRLGVPGLRTVAGSAPAALADLPEPHAIFVGGGATEPGLLELCVTRLARGGRLVAHGVTLETEAELLAAYRRWGGELTRISVEHAAPLGGFTGFTPARSVTQWSWRKSAERPS